VSRARPGGTRSGLASRPRPAAAPAWDPADTAARDRAIGPLNWLAAIGIGGSILIIIAASAARYSAPVALMPRPAGPLPVELPVRLPEPLVTIGLWAAAVMGGGGVVAGLAAVARGARYPAWLLITAALVAVAALAVLPPAGSTDTVSYATYGRMAVLGHDPYVMTPVQLHRTGDPIGQLSRLTWRRHPSLYGPVATAEQWAAARLGGTSAVRIVLWLKLWNAAAFAGVMLGLDRLLHADPARRARAHLLWSVNPLMLWALIAGGHLDVLAAAASLAGLTLLRAGGPGARPGIAGGSRGSSPRAGTALAAGMLVGVAADVMLTYLLLALALAWALRRSAAGLAAALAGVGATLVPAYLLIGPAIFHNLAKRDGRVGADTFYQLFSESFRHKLPPAMVLLVELAFIALALLMLWRLPDATPRMPAIQPALAISIAWLFIWYYQLPWYDTMAIGLLAVYPASRLDWAVMGQLTVATVAIMPGTVLTLHPHWLARLAFLDSFRVMPLLLLAALAALVWLCVSGAWRAGPASGPGSRGPAGLEEIAGQERLLQARAAVMIRVLCCQSSAMRAPAVMHGGRARPAGQDWCREDGPSDRKVTSRHSEFREQCHGYRHAAPGAAGRGRDRAGAAGPGPDLGVRRGDRELGPDHDRGLGRPAERGGPPDALAARVPAGRDRGPPAGRRDLRRALGRGGPGRRRRHRGAGRRGPRRAVSGLAADHGRPRRGRGVRRAAAGRLNRRPQLRHVRPDRRARPQPVRDDPRPASAQR
jgi:hypothetical protein